VTVTDVLLNQSASASDNDPSWVDLIPNLKEQSVQVDLLWGQISAFWLRWGRQKFSPARISRFAFCWRAIMPA
jgi:hypothetical protein